MKLTEKEIALVERMLEDYKFHNDGTFSIGEAASIRCLTAKVHLHKEKELSGFTQIAPKTLSCFQQN